ncbi:MAG: hypothetical protein L0Z62_12555 [Gemmataceae bacterium]|nr:hypothetical protein [Gemmataceae bacterium]
MSDQPLLDELRDLARRLASTDDEDVRDSADIICRDYRRERLVAVGLAAVESMVNDGPDEVDEDDPLLEAVRVRLRDRLRALLLWAKETGRM